MKKFLKGIAIGLGGVSPGLSGSVMMVIFGLYEKCIESISGFLKNPKENFKFLFPLFCGIGIGVLLFGKLVSFLLDNYEMYTRFAFLGLVLGTLPLFNKAVKKKGFNKKYYILMALAFLLGLFLLFNVSGRQISGLNIFQSVIMGLLIAASTIIPGVDSAVILSSLGFYEIYVHSVADLNLTILVPALFGVGIGVLLFSTVMNKLIKKYYTITYSIIFGLFISIIPSVLDGYYNLGFNFNTLISIILLVVGFMVSYFMGKLEKS